MVLLATVAGAEDVEIGGIYYELVSKAKEAMTSIGNYAFYGCSGLTAVHISDIATSAVGE